MTDITSLFWKHIQDNKTKNLESKIYNWLNKDNLGEIILDNNVFWFVETNFFCTTPNYIHDYIVKWGKQQGYKYLYEN